MGFNSINVFKYFITNDGSGRVTKGNLSLMRDESLSYLHKCMGSREYIWYQRGKNWRFSKEILLKKSEPEQPTYKSPMRPNLSLMLREFLFFCFASECLLRTLYWNVSEEHYVSGALGMKQEDSPDISEETRSLGSFLWVYQSSEFWIS